MSRFKIIRIVLILSFLISGGVVLARDLLNTNECIVPAETVIDGTLFVLCQDLQIHGTVKGDVIGAAVRSEIDGRIFGDVYLASSQLDIYGHIAKDLIFGGVVLRLNPPPASQATGEDNAADALRPKQWIGGSIKALSLSTTVFENTTVDDGILNAGYQLIIDGDVNNEMTFWGSALLINGNVGGDVYAIVGNPESESRTLETLLLPFKFDVELTNPGLIIDRTARISGNLHYTGPVAGQINGRIAGIRVYQETLQNVIPTLEEPGSLAIYFAQMGREFTTLLAIGAVAIVLVPGFLSSPLRNLRARPFSSFSVGMLAFLLSFPVVLIVAVLSVSIIVVLRLINLNGLVVAVGIVLGMVNLGGVSIFYFVAIFVARALVGLALGRFALRLAYQHREGTLWLLAELALGLFLLSAIISLPVIGLLFNAAALFMGLGTILNVLLIQFRRWREATPTQVAAWYAPSPAVTRRQTALASRPRPKIISTVDEEDDDIYDEDEYEDDDNEIKVIIPQPPLPLPDDDPYPLVGPGMTNLPKGFDFGFFNEDEPDSES